MTARDAISDAKGRVRVGLSLLGLAERSENKSVKNSVIHISERGEDISSCEHILVYLNGTGQESNPRMGSTCEASEGAEDARDGGGGGVLQIQENGVLLQTKEQQRD